MPTSFLNLVGIISTFAIRAVLAYAKANAIAYMAVSYQSKIKFCQCNDYLLLLVSRMTAKTKIPEAKAIQATE
jgi:hypothetical protein